MAHMLASSASKSRASASKRRTPQLAMIALVALIMSGCAAAGTPTTTGEPGSAASGSTTTINVGLIPVADASTVYIARDRGYFNDEGLDVNIQVMQNAANIVPGVLNGQIQFGSAALVPAIAAISNGVPIQVTTNSANVQSSTEDDTSALVVAKDSPIKRPKDLEGKTVAVNALQAVSELVTRQAIADDGGDPSLVKFVVVTLPESVAAVERGDVDAALLNEPFTTDALDKGLVPISRPFTETLVKGGSVSVFFASKAFIASDPDAVTGFTRAVDKAAEDVAKDPSIMRDALVKYGNLSEDVAKKVHLPLYTPTEVSAAAVEQSIKIMSEQGFIKKMPSVTDVIAK